MTSESHVFEDEFWLLWLYWYIWSTCAVFSTLISQGCWSYLTKVVFRRWIMMRKIQDVSTLSRAISLGHWLGSKKHLCVICLAPQLLDWCSLGDMYVQQRFLRQTRVTRRLPMYSHVIFGCFLGYSRNTYFLRKKYVSNPYRTRIEPVMRNRTVFMRNRGVFLRIGLRTIYVPFPYLP